MKPIITWLLLFFATIVNAQNLYFPPNTGNTWETLPPEALNWCPEKIDLLNTYLEENNTKAFILLKDGKIVIESYFDSHTATSPWYWASAGKSLTAFVVGMAQQEGYLSIDEPTSTYLGQGWTSCSPTEEIDITIKNQLSMTTGLNDDVPNQNCTDSSCLNCIATPGTRWAYHNAPFTLLEQTIANATGFTLNNYTNQKVLTPTGITGLYIPVDDIVVFFSTARSMARFGLLMLNNGNWDGNQIMTDTNYFNEMISTSQPLNEAYGYLWWLNDTSTFMVPGLQTVFNGSLFPQAPSDTFSALGKDGQFINVVPSQNLVWIRMGENPDALPVPLFMNNEIWGLINDLECELKSVDFSENKLNLFPNPVQNSFTITSIDEIVSVDVFNFNGQLIENKKTSSNSLEYDISNFASGIYIVKVTFSNGKNAIQKIVTE